MLEKSNDRLQFTQPSHLAAIPLRWCKLVLSLTSVFVASASYADWKQHVVLCFDVKNNTTPYTFSSSFVSSDVFDRGNSVKKIQNGSDCVHHTYLHGPKNLKLTVTGPSVFCNVILVPDSTCRMHYGIENGVVTDYISTDKHSLAWKISLVQVPPRYGYKYTFNVTCSYQAD